ncbi:hypothetical protein EYF80_037429 [Liparis tanakae]|uniref:Uncharacterized protein n=1 Tax=Liparis tanakae TaxID=230148 RepID=A0A4Z2GFP7_9TELE|nr:hypothetical protein EYF80_037429 [Liparis tanakae]
MNQARQRNWQVDIRQGVVEFPACGVYALHSRYANLKQVVLDELLAQHSDAQLDAQLHEAAGMGTLEGEEGNSSVLVSTNY